ncbi:MAG TPA: DUF6510 family protein [Solirubrobacteraceae bacterium]|nr:DUF6510 family protein [Solirubrobacteraceae bacterium]
MGIASEIGGTLWDERYALDGNAIAGLLEEVFEADMTTARRVCRSCGTTSAIGAHRAYRGAGVVLRCPACRDLAVLIAPLPDRSRVWLVGEWTIETPPR